MRIGESEFVVACVVCDLDIPVRVFPGVDFVEMPAKGLHATCMPGLFAAVDDLEVRVSAARGPAFSSVGVWRAVYGAHMGLESLVRSGRKQR